MASRQAHHRRQPKLGRPPRHENQRERVISCASELFARHGYENVGLSQLADAVGISKAGLYHYFTTKQEILDEIVLTTLDGLLAHVDAKIGRAATPRERLVAFMTAHAEYFEANYWAFTTMLVGFSGIARPSARTHAVDRRDRYEGVLRTILAEGMERGDFRKVDLATASRGTLSMLNWMARWYKPDGPTRASEVAAAYADLLLNGIGPSDGDAALV
jgi:TetR/AcrR family transcriptional regulator, cholesterol catabolism regulator